MATFNSIKTTKFFSGSQINKREKSASQSITTLSTITADITITSTDGIDYINADTTGGAIAVTLPAEAESKGRCLCVNLETDGGTDVTIDDDGGSTIATLDTATNWVEVYCTGAAWVITKGNGYT